MNEHRRNTVSVMTTRSERERMVGLARDLGHTKVSEVIRERFPEVFHEAVREGRKPGFSPKKKTG